MEWGVLECSNFPFRSSAFRNSFATSTGGPPFLGFIPWAMALKNCACFLVLLGIRALTHPDFDYLGMGDRRDYLVEEPETILPPQNRITHLGHISHRLPPSTGINSDNSLNSRATKYFNYSGPPILGKHERTQDYDKPETKSRQEFNHGAPPSRKSEPSGLCAPEFPKRASFLPRTHGPIYRHFALLA